MTHEPQRGSSRQLNLFVFPTETDVRFRLMVLLVAGSILGLSPLTAQAVLSTLVPDRSSQTLISELVALLSSFATLLGVFGVSVWRAQHMAEDLIRKGDLRSFPPASSYPAEQTSFLRMQTYIAHLTAAIPALTRLPQFYWDAHDTQCSGMAFGYRERSNILLRGGMHAAFLKLRTQLVFPAILLHELAHLVNRDLDKSTFTNALDRTFREVVAGMLIVLNGLTLFGLVRGAMFGTSRTPSETGQLIALVIVINLLLLLQIGLVRVMRGSVLRVREHYADLRARDWLGQAAPLCEMLRQAEANAKQREAAVGAADNGTSTTARVEQGLHARILRLAARLTTVHPPYTRRLSVLDNADTLGRLQLDTVLLSGLLIGLTLNAGMNLISQANILLTLDSRVNAIVPSSSSYAVVQRLGMVSLLLEIGWASIVIVAWVSLCLLPLVGTLGIQVQVDAFARSNRPGRGLALTAVAFLLAVGIVVGGALAPIPSSFSLWGPALALAPFLMFAWAIVIMVWVVPLSISASRLFSAHRGQHPPDTRRRWLSALAALAVVPGLFVITVSHVFLSQSFAFDDRSAPQTIALIELIIGALLVALLISACIWGTGLLLMQLLGWFHRPPCPGCGTLKLQQNDLSLWCSSCGVPLMEWALPTPCIDLPLPPEPADTQAQREAPPL